MHNMHVMMPESVKYDYFSDHRAIWGAIKVGKKESTFVFDALQQQFKSS